MNITAANNLSCSGCGVCAAFCPKHAISLKVNNYGFFSPVVDNSLCIECGACQKVCLRFSQPETVNLFELEPMALQSSNPMVVHNSSSGGIAHELAEMELNGGGNVVGAVYDLEHNCVKHKIIATHSELYLLDGSKYL